jgi:hypothetical protein
MRAGLTATTSGRTTEGSTSSRTTRTSRCSASAGSPTTRRVAKPGSCGHSGCARVTSRSAHVFIGLAQALYMPCGIVRGALACLGIQGVVTAELGGGTQCETPPWRCAPGHPEPISQVRFRSRRKSLHSVALPRTPRASLFDNRPLPLLPALGELGAHGFLGQLAAALLVEFGRPPGVVLTLEKLQRREVVADRALGPPSISSQDERPMQLAHLLIVHGLAQVRAHLDEEVAQAAGGDELGVVDAEDDEEDPTGQADMPPLCDVFVSRLSTRQRIDAPSGSSGRRGRGASRPG